MIRASCQCMNEVMLTHTHTHTHIYSALVGFLGKIVTSVHGYGQDKQVGVCLTQRNSGEFQ